MTQSTIRVDGANMIEVKVVDDDHSVSWKVATKGSLEFIARAHIKDAEYLAISLEEMPYGVNAKNRATMATLDKPAVWALRNMLNDAFGHPVSDVLNNTPRFTECIFPEQSPGKLYYPAEQVNKMIAELKKVLD